MKANTFYFSHDNNAHDDEKMMELRMEHGPAGYGIYWILVELMHSNSETALSSKGLKPLAFSKGLDAAQVQAVVDTCITVGLFVSDGESFWSESLRRRKDVFVQEKKRRSEAGKKGMQSRWNKKKEDSETQSQQGSDNTVITNDNTVITEDNKVNESKVNESKVNESKVSDKKAAAPTHSLNDFGRVIQSYEKNISFHIGTKQRDLVQSWITEYQNIDLILYALERAHQKNPQKPQAGFVDYLLKEWGHKSLQTVEEAFAFEETRESRPKTKAGVDWDQFNEGV